MHILCGGVVDSTLTPVDRLSIFDIDLFIYFTVKHGLHSIKALSVQQGCKKH